MTDNTPLNADDEMYREVEYCVTMEYKAPNGEPAKSRIDRLMKMILADRKKHELRARIDELNSLPHRSVTALTGSVDQSVIYERLDELKQELEKI